MFLHVERSFQPTLMIIFLYNTIFTIFSLLDINRIEMALHIFKIWRYKTGKIQKSLFFQIYLGNYGFRVQKELKVTNIQNDNLFCYKIFFICIAQKTPGFVFQQMRCIYDRFPDKGPGKETNANFSPNSL